MPKRIPITAAKRFAHEQSCKQVIVLAWDGERTHVVTYGITPTHCKQAAQGGQKLARFLGLIPAEDEVSLKND
jgi:hypothetical protein